MPDSLVAAQADAPLYLLEAAVAVARNAYSPYSKFCVGAAVETADGTIYRGANMENASFGITACAEVGAFQACSSAGKLGQVLRVAIVGGPRAASTTPGAAVMPCGRCRQIIYESAALSGRKQMEVWCADLALTDIVCHRIGDLLPHGFGPEALPRLEA